MGRHLSPRYGQVILVSGYPVLTAVNWSQHWCPMDVCIISFPVLCRRLNIDHDLVKQLTGQQVANKSRHLDELTHELAIPSSETGQWLSCFESRQLTILWMSNMQDVDLPRYAWDIPPSLLIVSPTPPLKSVDARSITWQPNEKRSQKLFSTFSKTSSLSCDLYTSMSSWGGRLR